MEKKGGRKLGIYWFSFQEASSAEVSLRNGAKGKRGRKNKERDGRLKKWKRKKREGHRVLRTVSNRSKFKERR